MLHTVICTGNLPEHDPMVLKVKKGNTSTIFIFSSYPTYVRTYVYTSHIKGTPNFKKVPHWIRITSSVYYFTF